MILNWFMIVCIITKVSSECVLNNITYENVVVTINENDEPYWYQSFFSDCVDGNVLKDIVSKKLKVSDRRTDLFQGSVEISNFPDLLEIYMDNINLKKSPYFFNLPKIKIIDLSYNKLRNIKRENNVHVPVKELLLSYNNISAIENGSFGGDLEVLHLTCNQLTTVSSAWFSNPETLRRLQLAGNKILKISDNFLYNFASLRRLELRNNEIANVGTAAFVGPSNLTHVDLSYNNITEIKADVFPSQGVSLNYLDLQYNKLSFLSDEFMEKVRSQTIKTWANPWQCPCLEKIERWKAEVTMLEEGLHRLEDPSCVYAASFSQSCVPFVDMKLYSDFIKQFELHPLNICENKRYNYVE